MKKEIRLKRKRSVIIRNYDQVFDAFKLIRRAFFWRSINLKKVVNLFGTRKTVLGLSASVM